jgi:hypothetical protein
VKPADISGKKWGYYLRDKINELTTNRKKRNIKDVYRGKNEFKRGYKHRSNLVKDENGDLLADSCNILKGERATSLNY